jgi:hypothetical protein
MTCRENKEETQTTTDQPFTMDIFPLFVTHTENDEETIVLSVELPQKRFWPLLNSNSCLATIFDTGADW